MIKNMLALKDPGKTKYDLHQLYGSIQKTLLCGKTYSVFRLDVDV